MKVFEDTLVLFTTAKWRHFKTSAAIFIYIQYNGKEHNDYER